MKHYTDEAWQDCARGLLPAEKLQLMRSHLETGCSQCAQLFALWDAAQQTAGQLSEDEPAVAAVRVVKAAFSQMRPAPYESLFGGVARLLFDSLMTAPADGVRSISSTARHLLYQFEGLTIDLRLDSSQGGKELMVSGQILDVAAGGTSALSAAIVLMRSEQELDRTRTNEFGEFQLTGAAGADLSIRVDLPEQKPITLKLPE